jgi:aspartyl-tRNA(Asn)/glutamyl-tRNA(Gln) amidotransferase subunit B
LRPEWLAHLVQLIEAGTLSGKMAKEVFGRMVEQGVDPAQIVQEEGLRQVIDPAALEQVAEAVVQANQGSVEAYLSGKVNALTFLMGQAMKQSQGKVNPQQMTEVLKRKLETLSRR